MEQPSHPRITQENLSSRDINRINSYGLYALTNLMADRYFRGNASEELDAVTFVAPDEILDGSIDEKQDWLNQELATAVIDAEQSWAETGDDHEWRVFQYQIMLWYQKGLIILDLITEQDIRDYEMMMRESTQVYERRTDAMRVRGSEIPDTDLYTPPHP